MCDDHGRPGAIAISGNPGSGKSTVAALVAASLSLPVVSAGTRWRQEAQELGISALRLNQLAETEMGHDDRIDEMLRVMEKCGTRAVFDSRMAWKLIPSALSVHLTVDPIVGAQRLYARVCRSETYHSPSDALICARERVSSERLRFMARHGVDIASLRNYVLVIDTTAVNSETVAAEIVKARRAEFDDSSAERPYMLLVSPATIGLPAPTEITPPCALPELIRMCSPLNPDLISVDYRNGRYSDAEDQWPLRGCLDACRHLMPVRLRREDLERPGDGWS